MKTERFYQSIKIKKFTPFILCSLITSLAFTCNGFGWEEKIPPSDDQVPAQPNNQPALPANQNNVSSANMVGDWYGPPCEEAEGTFVYRTAVNLMQNPDTNQIVGTVKFHDCPGGGKVVYRVVGVPQSGDIIMLTGNKVDGGGALFSSAQAIVPFTFNRSSGKITPQPVSSQGNSGFPMKPVGFLNSGSIAYTVQAQTYLPPGETNLATPSDASTVAMVGEKNSSSYLLLPLGTYTWCYYWEVGDTNNDGYLEYRHAYDTRPLLLDNNSPDEPETARGVTLSAPPASGDEPGTCSQP